MADISEYEEVELRSTGATQIGGVYSLDHRASVARQSGDAGAARSRAECPDGLYFLSSVFLPAQARRTSHSRKQANAGQQDQFSNDFSEVSSE
jgi:hypothetical protein